MNLNLKSLDEILEKFAEVIHRYRRRYLQRNLRPCPVNCKFADLAGQNVMGCTACGSNNPDRCVKTLDFVPLLSKEELAKQFRDELRNPQILLRDYRDIVVFMWVLGVPVEQKVDERVLARVENHNDTESTSPTTSKHRVIHSTVPNPLVSKVSGPGNISAKNADTSSSSGNDARATTGAK